MTTNRKIQSEIDRTLKKVQEGIEVFEGMWDKVHQAPNQMQKERFESELKKEIKKLQRLREQIKGWQASPEIKDKRTINDARKLIESKMEMFKVCEKETKTKAYSKEGLALPSKTDPADAAKHRTISWINNNIQTLNDAIDAMEAELEAADIKKGNTKGKGSTREEQMMTTVQRHKFHIAKLEQVLRMIDNDELTPQDVDEIEDSVQNYADANGEVPQDEEEGIYDCLDLPAIEVGVTNSLEEEEEVPRKAKTEEKKPVPPSKPLPAPVAKAQPAIQPAMVKTMPPQPAPAKAPISPRSAKKTPVAPADVIVKKAPTAAAAAAAATAAAAKPPAPQPPVGTKSATTTPTVSTVVVPSTSVAAPAATVSTHSKTVVAPPSKPPSGKVTNSPAATPVSSHDDNREDAVTESVAGLAEGSAVVGSDLNARTNEWKTSQTAATRIQNAQAAPGPVHPMQGSSNALSNNTPAPAPITASQVSSPSTTAPSAPLIRLDRTQTMKMLDMSFKNLPHPTDCEKAKPYMPPNPYRTMAFYPQIPHPIFNTPEVFAKFEADTLFFIFYYQQATYQQYLAAVELKKQSWRYHKKYLTWFQRHEKPKVATEEYEVGNYLYFDYESGWSQRVKQDFTFKYSYLEDELPVT